MRTFTFIFMATLVFSIVSCADSVKTIEDEDIRTNNSLDQNRLMNQDEIKDFRFVLKGGWKLAEPSTDRSRWIFKDGPLNGEFANLTVEIVEGPRYFYHWKDIDQQLANELAARMFWATRFGTNMFKFQKKGQRTFKVGELLRGWMVVYHDYADRDQMSGQTLVYAQAGIWEMQRQILFKLVTTPKGWGEYWADNFREMLQSCRSERAIKYQMHRLREGKDNVNIEKEEYSFKYKNETITAIDRFSFELQNSWIWISSENGKHTFSRQLANGEPAMLVVEEEAGENYFYKASDVNVKLDKVMKEKMADTSGKTTAYKLYDKECELTNPGAILKGWKVVYEDFVSSYNKNFVFVDSAVWEIGRQIKFKMSTTPKGWNSEYLSIFRDILNSCKSEKIK